MTLVSKGDSPPNPDDALAPRNPDDDLIPCMSTALAAARRCISVASVDSVGDVPITFQKWVGSLPEEERETLTSSYLHYSTAEGEWKRQTGEDDGKGKKKQTMSLIVKALQRLRREPPLGSPLSATA